MKLAEIKYKNGWLLILPTTGNAPLLFLEWISEFNSGQLPIQNIDNKDYLEIRFHTITKDDITKCAEYINSNL